MSYFAAFNRMLTVTNASSPYSFVVPPNVTVLYVEAWGPGGGGSGGGGGSATGATPGGGGGGSFGNAGLFVFAPLKVVPGETVTITVPAGGAAGTGGSGGNNAVGSDGNDGSNASDTTVAGSLQTITAKGGRATSNLTTPASTPRGKGGTGSAGGAAGTAGTSTYNIIQNTPFGGTFGYGSNTQAFGQPQAGVTNASGGGGGAGGQPVPPTGAIGYHLVSAATSPSGTTGGSSFQSNVYDVSGLIGGATSMIGGGGGNGNGTNNGTQGTDTSANIGWGGAGGGGGGGNTAGGIAGNGADGRKGGPGLAILYYNA